MTLYIIGDNNESNKTIVEFAEEHNLEYKFSNIISSSKSFLGAINEASHYDVTIIDILDLMIENEEIDKGIHTLKDIYNGIVIIYAPSASYNDSKLNICSRYGYENIVRDFLGARAKARFKSFIPNLTLDTNAQKPQNVQRQSNPETNESNQNQEQRRSEPTHRRPDIERRANNSEPEMSVQPQQQIPQQPQRQSQRQTPTPVQYQQQSRQPQREEYRDNYVQPNQNYNYNSSPLREPRNTDYAQNDYQSNQNNPYNQPPVPAEREEKYEDTINNNENIVVTQHVGVIGVLHRIGTTTQAIMIANTLKSLGKSACYVQYNDSSFINNMENYFTGIEKSQSKGCLTYEGLDFFENKNLVLSQSYDYHIRDYGACDDTHQIPSEFFNNEIRIIVCGGTAEEVSSLTELRTQLFADTGIIFVFSFIADYERNDIMDLMGDKDNTVLFAPYTPDCYKLTDESKQMYMSAFGFEVETVKKKKKGFGFKRKKG